MIDGRHRERENLQDFLISVETKPQWPSNGSRDSSHAEEFSVFSYLAPDLTLETIPK